LVYRFFLSILAKINTTNITDYDVSLPISVHIQKKLKEIEFIRYLELLGFVPNRQLNVFDNNHQNLTVSQEDIDTEETNGADIYIEKIIVIMPNKAVSREQLLKETKRQIKDFLLLDSNRHFNHEQILLILLEMAKNTIDHSGKPAILGLQLFKHAEGSGRFSFVYCDIGDGIYKTIRNIFKRALSQLTNKTGFHTAYGLQKSELAQLAHKAALTDILYWAFQPGNSTRRDSGVNLGLGLRWIIEGSKKCNMRLYLKDASSILNLTKISSPYTRDGIRQLSIRTCAPVLFFYYGELKC